MRPLKKDHIKCSPYSDFIIIKIKQPNTEQPSYLFCNKIEYMHDKDKNYFDHHIMIYRGDKLIFKVWLPNSEKDKEFKSAKEALESVGMEIQK